MRLLDYAYIPIIAFLNLGIVYFWHKKIRKQWFKHKADWAVLYLTSFLTTWGMDVLHHTLVTTSLIDPFKISLGVWMLFSAASAFKYYRFRERRIRDFWYDYSGDLISYFFIGLSIYICT